MRLVFHGILKTLFGSEVRMQAKSVADAVEGFSRQQPNWPKDVVVSIVGFDTPKAIFETDDVPDEIHIMPQLAGGGGNWGRIILGTAVAAIGAAVFFFVPGGQQIGISLMISGGMMVLQGVVGLFMKSPSLKGSDDPKDSSYLGINQNTTASRTPINMAWGRVNIHPHWLSLASDSSKLSHGMFPVTPT